MRSAFAKSLRNIKLFVELDATDLADIESACLWTAVDSGEQVISYLDGGDDVFFITQGAVRVIIYSKAGREVSFRTATAGEMFGEMSAIDGRPRSASVEALKDCVVARLQAARFRDIVARHPMVALALIQHLVSQVRGLTARVYEFSTLAVNNRIHAELLRLARQGSIKANQARIEHPPTHAEIASRISTHREAVSREFSNLTAKGLLKKDGSAHCITDLALLARMVEDATGD